MGEPMTTSVFPRRVWMGQDGDHKKRRDTFWGYEARALAVGGVLPGWWTWSDDDGATWCDLPLYRVPVEEVRDGEVWRMVDVDESSIAPLVPVRSQGKRGHRPCDDLPF